MRNEEEPTGTSRRDVLKRGAVVGGALVWTTPVVQSLGGVAFGATPSDVAEETPVVNRAASVTISRDTDTRPSVGSDYNSTAGGFNVPQIALTNASDAGVLLTGFSLTVGDTTFNFDFVRDEVASTGVVPQLVSPDRVNEGGVRSNVLAYTFTGFQVGSTFNFEADLDPDGGSPTTDFRQILFNSSPSAVATFTFSQGAPLSVTLAGATGLSSYTFSVAGPA